MLTLDERQLESNIKCSKACFLLQVYSLFSPTLHNSHLLSPYLLPNLYWEQTIAYKISNWSLLFPHICRCFRMKMKGSGSSLELLRYIQRMVHPLFCCSPDTRWWITTDCTHISLCQTGADPSLIYTPSGPTHISPSYSIHGFLFLHFSLSL